MPPPSPTAPSMVEGELVGGRYRLLHPIGAGAMGTVWAARHELLGRDFAIKFARLPSTAEADARKRFLDEAQIAGKLRHPNIVDVADFGEIAEGQGLYLAMELLSGESLAEHLSARGALKAAEAIAIAIEICRGLQAAHAIGVVHGDIKPENIFLARGSTGGIVPKLLDFGISKKASPGDPLALQPCQPFGTPAYMSPEQALGESDIDRASDIWAMGVVLYEMTTGQHPFVAPTYAALMARIADNPPAPLPEDVPAPLRSVIHRCLAKRRSDRYSDAGTLHKALGEVLTSISASHGGALMIERLHVLSSASRDPSGHAPAVLSLPARGATRMRWALFSGLGMAVVGALVPMWIHLGGMPEPPSGVATGPAAAPSDTESPAAMQAQPSPAAGTPMGSATALAPSAAASSAVAPKAAPALTSGKPPPRNTSRTTKVNVPGF